MNILRFVYRLVKELVRLLLLLLQLLNELKEFLTMAFNYLSAKLSNASALLDPQVQTRPEDLGVCS